MLLEDSDLAPNQDQKCLQLLQYLVSRHIRSHLGMGALGGLCEVRGVSSQWKE